MSESIYLMCHICGFNKGCKNIICTCHNICVTIMLPVERLRKHFTFLGNLRSGYFFVNIRAWTYGSVRKRIKQSSHNNRIVTLTDLIRLSWFTGFKLFDTYRLVFTDQPAVIARYFPFPYCTRILTDTKER